ncbi:hypothetical protein ACP2W0_09715 [Pseudobacillus badius]|uniref:hypothetical protein n=1 Tax=Bacillus badius TaxID=1455 RepID=UPI0007B06EB3|nr:hypothetical protein [Bacillus badius]KZN99811.1 hypothetical protein A4244_17620 [Bacillus badius]KZR58770.1 hypothetical protein A3781_14595 [Bacillus badius]MED0666604.1 hypothetical protein [Bacillus badius]OCS85914.1 hypothetical protein A6M11_17635 [Bacillus badius]OVE51726.1 hypothetical protein B1A98_09190 [Bacillus badius]
MNKKPTAFLLTVLLVLLTAVSSLDFSSRQLVDEKTSLQPDSAPVIAEAKGADKQWQPKSFKLEEQLVNREEIGHYIVETYREYEVYTDGQGNVKESVPTSNYNYIRYRKN